MASTKKSPSVSVSAEKESESPSIPTSEAPVVSDVRLSVTQKRLQSVHFVGPTDILNLSSLDRLSNSQANLETGTLYGVAGVFITSKDDRVRSEDFVPLSAIKRLRYA